MMPKNKSSNVFFQLLRNLRESKQNEAKILIDKILSNGYKKEISQSDLNLSIKLLRLELDSEDNLQKMNEQNRIVYQGWIDMLCNLNIYYIEREKAGAKVEDYFQNFFESCKCLLEMEQTRNVFAYISKYVVKEYLRVIKTMKQLAKDSEAVKRASHATKNLESICIQIFQQYAREINVKNCIDLKLANSNQSMKLYFLNFKFDRAAGCDKVKTERQLIENSPISDLITYNYYKGRILIFQSEFAQASRHLQEVLDRCPYTTKGFKFKKQVLKYLIPVNLFLGKHPTEELLNFYKLYEYQGICEALQQGNIKYLQSSIEKYKQLWVRRSLLILMDQLKVLCYRNLCKKVYLIMNKEKKFEMAYFLKAFTLSHPENQPPSMPEVCCIVANLIYLDLISGKIYQDIQKNLHAITLGKDPFGKRPDQINWSK